MSNLIYKCSFFNFNITVFVLIVFSILAIANPLHFPNALAQYPLIDVLNLISKGHDLYYLSNYTEAIKSFDKALQLDSY